MRRLSRLTRYDCAFGFVICENGRPYQACRRDPTPEKLRLGHCGNEYWLRPVDGAMDPLMLKFLMTHFRAELDAEWERRI